MLQTRQGSVIGVEDAVLKSDLCLLELRWWHGSQQRVPLMRANETVFTLA
jgi:hypothetical protein